MFKKANNMRQYFASKLKISLLSENLSKISLEEKKKHTL